MSIKYSLRLLNFIFAAILLILSSFLIINLNAAVKTVEIFAFLENDLNEEGAREVGKSLKDLKGIKSIRFSPPEETVKIWAKTIGRRNLVKTVGENPFPPLFRIELKKGGSIKNLRRTAAAFQEIKGIKTVEYGGKRTEEAIRRTKRYLFVSVFAFFAALINILNYFFTMKEV